MSFLKKYRIVVMAVVMMSLGIACLMAYDEITYRRASSDITDLEKELTAAMMREDHIRAISGTFREIRRHASSQIMWTSIILLNTITLEIIVLGSWIAGKESER